MLLLVYDYPFCDGPNQLFLFLCILKCTSLSEKLFQFWVPILCLPALAIPFWIKSPILLLSAWMGQVLCPLNYYSSFFGNRVWSLLNSYCLKFFSDHISFLSWMLILKALSGFPLDSVISSFTSAWQFHHLLHLHANLCPQIYCHLSKMYFL